MIHPALVFYYSEIGTRETMDFGSGILTTISKNKLKAIK